MPSAILPKPAPLVVTQCGQNFHLDVPQHPGESELDLQALVVAHDGWMLIPRTVGGLQVWSTFFPNRGACAGFLAARTGANTFRPSDQDVIP